MKENKKILNKMEDLVFLDRLTSKSKLTENDVLDISKKVNASVSRKLKIC